MFYSFLGATFWGLSGVCSDFLFSEYGISPLFLTMVRALGAGLLFACMILIRHRPLLLEMLSDKKVVQSLLIFGALGIFPCQIVYLMAVDMTNAGTATVFQSLNIVFIAMFSALIAHKPLRKNEVLAVAAAFCSVFVIATQGNPSMLSMSLSHFLWCLFLGVAESFYVVYPEKLFQRFGSFVPTGIAMLVSGFLSSAFWLATSMASDTFSGGTAFPELDDMGIFILVLVTVVGTFLSFSLFLKGVSKAGAVAGSLMGAMEPLSAAILSVLLLSTPFSVWDWLGLAFMVATFLLTSVKHDGSIPKAS